MAKKKTKSCKFGKVSRGRRKGQCRKSKKTSKKRRAPDNMMLNGARRRR